MQGDQLHLRLPPLCSQHTWGSKHVGMSVDAGTSQCFAMPPCLQACGFIALYVHLAALAHATYIAQPQVQLGSTMWVAREQLLPPALIAGLIMWVALCLHQGCYAIMKAMQLSVSPAPMNQKQTAPVSSLTGIEKVDSMAFQLYTSAHQLSAKLAQMSVEHEPDTCSFAPANIKELLVQLRDTLSAANAVVRSMGSTTSDGLHISRTPALLKAWYHGNKIAGLCGRLKRLSSQNVCEDNGQVSFNSLVSVATTISAETNNPDLYHPLPPALKQAGSLHTELEGDHMTHERGHSEQLLQWQKEHLTALDLPSPASILHAFPPPPPDLQQWATFYHNSCPVSLGRQPSTAAKPWFEWVQLPSPLQANSAGEQVEAFVTETKAQLGGSFYALAPVAAAISHRPKTWVGTLLQCLDTIINCQSVTLPGQLLLEGRPVHSGLVQALPYLPSSCVFFPFRCTHIFGNTGLTAHLMPAG
jgi:hypothetical protein